MSNSREISDYDIFAQPVTLRFKGQTHYKNSVGGMLAICYWIMLVFVAAVLMKALVLGYYIGAASTTRGIIFTDDDLNDPVDVSDLNIRFGFRVPPTIMSGKNDNSNFQTLRPEVGRFELLRIEKFSDDTRKIQRIPITPCGSLNCISSSSSLTVYGDFYTSSYAVLVLQVRPCQNNTEIKGLMTESQITDWKSKRASSATESPDSGVTCASVAERNNFFNSNRLIVKNNINQFKPDGTDTWDNNPLPELEIDVTDMIIGNNLTNRTFQLEIQQNQVFYSQFWTKLFGNQLTNVYLTTRLNQQSSLVDFELTRGYIHTNLIMKSRYYDSTEVVLFQGIEFIGMFTSISFGFYMIFKIFYGCLPVSLNSELETIQKVYRVQETQPDTNISQLKRDLKEIAEKLHSEVPDGNSLQQKMKKAIRMKLFDRLQTQIDQIQSVKGFATSYNKLALTNLMENSNRQQANQSLLMYLSANLFHKPKFPEISWSMFLRITCFRSFNSQTVSGKQVEIARRKLNKDLDMATYLRTVNNVKGIVQCSLDDKQRMMLKYSQQRMVYQKYFEEDERPTNIIETANVIYSKFAESGIRRNEQDFRYLLGLGNVWGTLLPIEFIPKPIEHFERTPVKELVADRQAPQDAVNSIGANFRYNLLTNNESQTKIQQMSHTNIDDINKTVSDFQDEVEAQEQQDKMILKLNNEGARLSNASDKTYPMMMQNFSNYATSDKRSENSFPMQVKRRNNTNTDNSNDI